MLPFEFTDEQLDLINRPGTTYFAACPGAGKTQSIVERFIRRPGISDRRGVALLSFTRAAISEALARTIDAPDLRLSPNFVGTIDTLINRYIIGPLIGKQLDHTPTFRDTWANVPGTTIEVRGRNFQAVNFELDWFSFSHAGKATLVQARVPSLIRPLVDRLPQWAKESVIGRAERRWAGLIDRGYIDCARARVLLQIELSDPVVRTRVGELLANRFYEVIVDEVQDCNESDLLVLDVLKEAGVNVVLVGDLEQSIFDFREASSVKLRNFVKSLGDPGTLSGNFRSSPAICLAVNSARSGNEIDVPAGKFRDEASPIYLLEAHDLSLVHARIEPILTAKQLPADEFIYLSHGAWAAKACVGISTSGKLSQNKVILLARAAIEFQSGNPQERLKTLGRYEYVLRSICRDEFTDLADSEFRKATFLNDNQLRNGFVILASLSDPQVVTPRDFLAAFRLCVRQLGWDGWADTSRLRAPTIWPAEIFSEPNGTRWSTIHGFKGRQSPGVGLVVTDPPRHHQGPSGIDLWRDGAAGEPRRILYVGISRAEKLLVLVVNTRSNFETMSEILARDEVPTRIV